MIGLALALNAQMIIADEPTTSLDVIVEAQILDLLNELQKAYNLTVMLITHNIGIVAELADRVAVMYAGRLAELADALTFFQEPLHPYTQDLLASVPNINLADDRLRIMAGSPPDLITPPSGCRFHPRCRFVREKCSKSAPPFAEVRPGHWTACWLYQESMESSTTHAE
jgi:oligopeptide/dipeptide ABC transporter ATP-binding protein